MPCAQRMCCIAACRIAPSRVRPTPTPQPAHRPALSRRCLPRVTPGFRQVARRPAQSCAASATGGAEHAHHSRACVSTVLRSLSCRAARSGNLGRGEQSACRQAGSLTGRPVARSFFARRHTPTASPSSMAATASRSIARLCLASPASLVFRVPSPGCLPHGHPRSPCHLREIPCHEDQPAGQPA